MLACTRTFAPLPTVKLVVRGQFSAYGTCRRNIAVCLPFDLPTPGIDSGQLALNGTLSESRNVPISIRRDPYTVGKSIQAARTSSRAPWPPPRQPGRMRVSQDRWRREWIDNCGSVNATYPCLDLLPVPADANTVVMHEAVPLGIGGMVLEVPASPGQNIRRCGDDVAEGAAILRPG